MAFGISLFKRYLPEVVPELYHSASWGAAEMDDEKRERKRAQEQRRREARARRQARS